MIRKMHNKMWFLAALVMTLVLLLPITASAAVWTDKPDYQPGETVTISGASDENSQYISGETVEVIAYGPNDYLQACLTADGLSPVVSEDGTWSCQVTLYPDERANGEYYYTANGLMSGVHEDGTFTDCAYSWCASRIYPVEIYDVGPSSGVIGTTITVHATLSYYWDNTGLIPLSNQSVAFYFLPGGWQERVVGQTDTNGIATADLVVPNGAYHLLVYFGVASAGWHFECGSTNIFPYYDCEDVQDFYDWALGGAAFTTLPSNTAPEITVDSDPMVVAEGGFATNTGTIIDADGDVVTLSASDGEITNNGDGTWAWSYQTNDGPDDSRTVTITADDGNDGISSASFYLTVNNIAPNATIENGIVTVGEGETAINHGTYTDPGTDSVILSPLGGLTDNGDGTWDWSFDSCDGPDQSQLVYIEATDSDGASSTAAFQLTVNNLPPEIDSITSPIEPISIGQPVIIAASFTDPGACDTHSSTVDWGDGTTEVIDPYLSGTNVNHTYAEAGVYQVGVTVTDDDGDSDSGLSGYVVVYDGSAGFVTGGGWIDSPAGAYPLDPDLTGKATFGFVSKYLKGAQVPTGNTEFQFQMADLNFHSTSYDWLVVTGSDYAMFKGVGTLNGQGTYKFMIWAGDGIGAGGADTFRIKIWIEEGGIETVIYDNGMDQVVSGGSIVVHTK